jgi:hypothetical protein
MEFHPHTTCWPDEGRNYGPAPADRERKRGPNRKTRQARSGQRHQLFSLSIHVDVLKKKSNLEDSSSVDDGMIIAGHLNPFHLFERLHNAEIFTVNGSERRYVDVIVLKGL